MSWADTATFTFSELASANSWSNGTAYTSVEIAPITLSAAGGGNNGKYYTSDTSWRMYTGGTVNITAAEGFEITGVSSNPTQSFTISNGSASLSLTATVKFKSITVTYSATGGTPTCATPTFSPAAGTFYEAQNVTISSTDGATIYYTIDGATPTKSSSVYTSAISVSETTTIKALAVKDSYNDSEVATATYTIKAPVAGYEIDFEDAVEAYTDWTMTNIEQGTSAISAQDGSYYGTTGGKTTASIETKSKVANPGILTFYVSKTSGNTTSSTWYVEVSSDGTSWEEITSQSASAVTQGSWTKVSCEIVDDSDNPYTDVYVRIRYDGSTAIRTIDAISLAEAKSVAMPTFSVEEGTYTAVQNVTITCTTDGATIYYTTDGTDPTSSSSVYSTPVVINESCTLKAIAIKGGEESYVASATYIINLPKSYNLATSIISGKHYVIAAGMEDGTVQVMGTQSGSYRSKIDASISSGVLNATGACEVVICGPDVDGNYTIYDETAKMYLYASSSSSNDLKSQSTISANACWKIDFDGENVASIVAQGANTRNVMQYNSSNPRFSCYATASQTNVYLFEKDGESAPEESVTIGATGYATYCSNNALNFSGTGITAYMAKAAGSSVTLTEIADGIVPAREGVVLMGTTDNVPVATALGSGYTAAENEMVGITARTQVDAKSGDNFNYILSNEDEGIGFYAASDDIFLAANKAYLSTTVDPTSLVKAFLGFTEGDADAISEIVNGKSVNGKWYDLSGRRVSKATKGIYIVNGKKVVK